MMPSRRWGALLCALLAVISSAPVQAVLFFSPAALEDFLREAGALDSTASTGLRLELNAMGSKLVAGDFAGAVRDLDALSAQHPDDTRIWLTLALAHAGTNDLEKGLAAVDRCLEIDPYLHQGHSLRGTIYTAQWKIDEADRAHAEAARLAPSNPNALLLRGRFLVLYRADDREKMQSGITTLERALELGAPSASAHGLLGIAFRTLNDLDKAERHYLQVLEVEPLHMGAIKGLVSLYLERGENAKSAALLKQAREAAGRLSKEDQGILALAEAMQAQAEKAPRETIEKHFRAAVEASPKDPRLLSEYAHWLDAQERFDETIALLTGAMKNPPFDPDLAAHLAWRLADAGTELDEALRWLNVARQKYGAGDPYLADTNAWIEYRREQYTAAWEALQPALSLSATIPEVAYHAGAIQARIGDRSRAIEFLNLALKSGEAFSGKEDAVRMLKQLQGIPGAAAPGTHRPAETLPGAVRPRTTFPLPSSSGA